MATIAGLCVLPLLCGKSGHFKKGVTFSANPDLDKFLTSSPA